MNTFTQRHESGTLRTFLLSAHDEAQLNSLAFSENDTFTLVSELKCCKAWNGPII